MTEGRHANNRKALGTRGESMVVAIALMLVFFVIGLSVLTSVSITNASVNTRIQYRQAYYYARSTLELLNESLVRGELGAYVCEQERLRLEDCEEIQLTDSSTLSLPLSFSMEAPEGLRYVDNEAVLSYDVVSRFINPDRMSLSLDNVVLSFHTEYAGKTHGILVIYSYEGSAERVVDDWVWTGTWKLRSML